jgi:hypothetical protein
VPGWARVGIQVPQLDKSNDCVTVLGMFSTEAVQVAGTVLMCLAGVGIQVPQLDKSNDCVTVLGMFGAEAEQVTGTVLLCLAVLGAILAIVGKSPVPEQAGWPGLYRKRLDLVDCPLLGDYRSASVTVTPVLV